MDEDLSAVSMTSGQVQRVDSGDEDDISYVSVHKKEEDVDYASVQFRSPSCAVNQWVTESVHYVLQQQHGVTTCLWPKYTR